MTVTLAAIIGYILLQLAIGLWVSRRVRDEADYLLAARKLGFWPAVFSMFATWFGAETCVGTTGAIYTDGLSGGSADPFGYALCLLLMGLLLAAPLRRRGYTTIADLFAERYGGNSERLLVFLLVPTSLMWAAAQIRAFGQVLAATSDLNITVTVTVAAIVTIVYTYFGGLLADVVTDLVQGVVLVAGLVGIFAVLWFAGDLAAIGTMEPQRLNLFYNEDGGWGLLEAWAVPVLGSLVSQELIVRTLAVKDPKTARRAGITAAWIYLLFASIPAVIGLVGPSLIAEIDDPEHVLTQVAALKLPTVLYVVFVGALISAILSTVDSTLLTAASLISHNGLRHLPGVEAKGPDYLLRLSRRTVAACGVVAFVIALSSDGIYTLIVESSALGSSGIVVLTLLGIYSKWGDGRAAIATLLTGLISYVIGSYIFEWATPYLISLGLALAVFLALQFLRPQGQVAPAV